VTITLADVQAAARTITGVTGTPSAVSHTLSEILGCRVVVKFENLQFTSSFKERGACNRIRTLTDDERARGVVAVSAGNHAQAVARHAQLAGTSATIVMPVGTPFVKVARTRHHGAEVILHGADVGESIERAREIEATGATFVHPYDDPVVIAGQGTVALELLTDHPDLDAIVVPVGGGGLLAGMAVVASAMAPHVELVGVQTDTWPSMANLLAGVPGCPGGPTLADGIAVRTPGSLTAPLIRDLTAGVVTVSEDAIEDAVNLLLDIEKVVVEGAGAAGVAAIASDPDRFAGRTVGVVLSGGNIDPQLLASLLQRGLVRAGRLCRLRVALDDRPGSLAVLLDVVGGAGANVQEVLHQRLFATVGARAVEVDITLECIDAAHRDHVVATLGTAGIRARVLPLDEL
jgi:threonine dehydratase